MGRPIVYCADCGRSLRDDDFQKGLAAISENRPFCSGCRAVERPSARVPAASGRTPKPFAAPPKRKSSTPLVAAALCGAALLLLIVGVLATGGPPVAPGPAEPVVEPPPPKKAPSESAERDAARRENAARLERYLKDIRSALDDPRFEERREEVRSMIARADELAGARRSEIDGLSALFARRDLEARLREKLVGHWTLDELTGTSAADASGSGHAGKVVGKASWTGARVGSGLETFGGGEHVELPDAEPLRSLQKGPYSLALWYLPRELPQGTDGPLHGLVVKRGHHSGLSYLPSGLFRMEHWIAGSKQQSASAPAPSPPGRFYHVAGTVDPERGIATLYVDGAKVQEKTWPKAPGRDYGSERWRIGTAHPREQKYWGPSKGVLDDVRIYAKVLTPEEVRFLFEAR